MCGVGDTGQHELFRAQSRRRIEGIGGAEIYGVDVFNLDAVRGPLLVPRVADRQAVRDDVGVSEKRRAYSLDAVLHDRHDRADRNRLGSERSGDCAQCFPHSCAVSENEIKLVARPFRVEVSKGGQVKLAAGALRTVSLIGVDIGKRISAAAGGDLSAAPWRL